MAETVQRSSSNDDVSIPMSQTNNSDLSGTNLKIFTEEAVISFHNISYRVQEKTGFLCHLEIFEREILSNINGIMKCGLNAIMGPRDAGKTLLLDILAGRKNPHGLSGNILINGMPQTANFKYNSGYMPQNDVVMGTLTVRENIKFTAALQLPTTMTEMEKRSRVNEIIELLGLKNVADSKARSEEVKKKTSLAMKLITDHQILFLDEPTTGLDWSTANEVMLLLKRMCKLGRTVIFSTSQRSYSIFRLFDSLTLLALGKLIFHGPAQEVLQFLESGGYEYKDYNNLVNFFLDVFHRYPSAWILSEETKELGSDKSIKLFKREDEVQKLAELYAKSSLCKKIKDELDELSEHQKEKSPAFQEITYATASCHQLRWIIWRSFKNLLGFPRLTAIQLIFTVLLAVIMGIIFRHVRNDCNAIMTRAGLLYMLTIFQCVTSVSAGELFVIDRKHFLHEHISGYYKITPYFFGKLLSEFILRRLFLSIIFAVIIYSITGVTIGVTGFFRMILTVLMLAYSASSVPLCLGAGENVVSVLTLFVITYFVSMLVLEGLLTYWTFFEVEFSWIQFFSIPHYGYTALQHNELLGQNFCLNTTDISTCQNYVICTGEEFLTIHGIDLSPWGFWKNHVILAVIMIALFITTYIQLFFVKEK